jgi:hypothetical protein
MNGPVTGMCLNRTALQYGRHRRSLFIGGEKEAGHRLKWSTQRVESFNPRPKGTRSLFESLLPQRRCACWPSAPSLIHVDQRQRSPRWSVKRDEQLQQRASKVQPPNARCANFYSARFRSQGIRN